MTRDRVLLVGLGSAHGDDQVGWAVAENVGLRTALAVDVGVRKALDPAELLDWIDGVERLHICDACVTDAPPGAFARWPFPSSWIEDTRFASTHTLSLPAVLRLSAQLGTLPREVVIWGISIASTEPAGKLSPLVLAAVPRVADRICQALSDA